VPSPTFPIVQSYAPPETRLPVWHVDLYRVEKAEELEELGLDEALYDGVLLIEWPERLPALWPGTLRLTLSEVVGGGRSLTAMVPAAWENRWPPR
jgi:tRNA threonylcarbamoyladenosine biosynthesis protein TsaE